MNVPDNSITFSSEEFGQLRSLNLDGDPWFVATDVCRSLGLDQVTNAIRRLDDDETTLISIKGRDTNIVNEPGLYSLILSSRKPEAKRFKRWVTHDVLPAIRRDGGYMVEREEETADETMARAVLIAQSTIDRQKARIAAMRPHALLGEAVSGEDALYTVTDATRYVAALDAGIKRKDVIGLLRARRIMCKKGTTPTRYGIDRELMRQVVSPPITHKDGSVTREQYGKLTGKGLAYLVSELIA